MREKFTWLIIAALALITIYHACGQQRRNAAAGDIAGQPLRPEREGAYADRAADSQWEEFRKWRGRVAERVERGDPLLPPDFDAFFGDAFFAGRRDPFGELERIRTRTSGELSGRGRGLFERNWDAWFDQRMRMEGFSTSLETSAGWVALLIKVPGLVPGSAAADVTAERIRVTFTARRAAEVGASGGELSKESLRTFTKILPLPAGADAAGAVAESAGDTIRIRFGRAR